MRIQAAIVDEAGGPFRLADAELQAPRADELLVRILGAGICHTDDAGRHGLFGSAFPAVFGHEGAGIVQEAGAAITTLRPGDPVVLSFGYCGGCPRCLAGEPAYCRHLPALNFIGCRPDGSSPVSLAGRAIGAAFFGQSSFATHAVVSERNAVKVDRVEGVEMLGPLGCGVQTGAGAVMRSLDCRPGQSLLVTGAGTVGLSAVMAARARGLRTIIVSEPHAARRALALELGATHAIAPGRGELTASVREVLAGGVDYALDTSGLTWVIAEAMMALANRGRLGLIGVPPSDTDALHVPLNAAMTAGWTIRGILEGDSDPHTFIPELLAMHRAGHFPFDRLVRAYPFNDINEAIADQQSGACIKAVLLMPR